MHNNTAIKAGMRMRGTPRDTNLTLQCRERKGSTAAV